MDVIRAEEVRYRLRLKRGRERSVELRHPWIYSGAVEEVEALADAAPGDLGDVIDADGNFVGRGTVQPDSQILCRVFTWRDEPINAEFFRERILRADTLRREFIPRDRTDAYRVINAEGDELPGLIVDMFGGVLAVQTLTAGTHRLRALWLDELAEMFHPQAIVERGERARREPVEGIEEGASPVLRGMLPAGPVPIRENGLHFFADLEGGQKTGFYLDQRDNRALVGSLSKHREVLNLFGYTGAFSIYAGAGGAQRVVQVETSASARQLALESWSANRLPADRFELVPDDAFAYLRSSTESFDVIVIDPPPLAKTRGNVEHALRAYKDLNMWALCRAREGALVSTFSCSQHVSGDLFQKVVFGAARDVDASVQWLGRLGPGIDHPVHLDHPQGEYLKGLLLRVVRPGQPPQKKKKDGGDRPRGAKPAGRRAGTARPAARAGSKPAPSGRRPGRGNGDRSR